MDQNELRTILLEAIAASERQTSQLRACVERLDGGGDEEAVPRQGRWSKTAVAQLWGETKHLPGIRALFELTASRPGEVVTYRELLDRSGLAEMQQRNEHSRLSRVSTELFGEKRWPIENWQGGAGPDGHAEMRYRMSPKVSAWWNQLERPAD
jgi:hypothetical protein